MDALPFIFSIIILALSVVVHEVSHGYTADLLGDPTPRMQGRLTLNPFKHLSMFGSFIMPIITSFLGITFGWAKPVEWNPYNVKNPRRAELLISLAGPASNLLLAAVFGILIRVILANPDFASTEFAGSFILISSQVVFTNLILATFNLIPVPPLDGSKILFSLISPRFSKVRAVLEQRSIFIMIVVALILWQFIVPIIPWIFHLLTGTH